MLEFILKDKYAEDYILQGEDVFDYLVKIYDVEHEENVISVIADYIQFIENNRDIMDDSEITYIRKFLDEMFPKHEIVPFKNLRTIYY